MANAAAGITLWSGGHTPAATRRVSSHPLALRAGLDPGVISALIEASALAAGTTAVVSRDGDADEIRGHLFIEPVVTGGWADTWWTHAHSWSAESPADLRALWAAAAQPAFDAGARDFYATVAVDDPLLSAWHSLSFGNQHIVATLPESAMTAIAAPVTTHALEFDITGPEAADASALALVDVLLNQALEASPVFSPVPRAALDEATDEWLETIEDDDYIIAVARLAGRVVGFALACSTEKSSLHSGLLRTPNSATLAQVNVEPEYRSCGIGSALARAVMSEAVARGFTSIVTDWRSTNISADAAWRSLGFVPTAYRLQRVVGRHG